MPGMTGTTVDRQKLADAVWKALGEPPLKPTEGIDYYCTVVADAIDLPAEEIQRRLRQGDAGIQVARNVVKGLLFMRVHGVSPQRAAECLERSTQIHTSGTQTSSDTAVDPSKMSKR